MAKSSNYRVQPRRRREGKTDYKARKAMVISRRNRLVARPSLRNVTVQIISAKPTGDIVLAAANSRELTKKYGWKAATGNVPSAYLTGLLCGLKAKTVGITDAILDIGMVIPTKGAKVFAILQGVLDAGINVPHNEEKMIEERTKGEHIAKYAKSLGVGSEEYTAKFSKYIAYQMVPEKLPDHFDKVKADILGAFKEAKVVELSKPQKSSSAEKKLEAKEPQSKAQKAKSTSAKEKVISKDKTGKAKGKAPNEKISDKNVAPKKKATKKGEKKE